MEPMRWFGVPLLIVVTAAGVRYAQSHRSPVTRVERTAKEEPIDFGKDVKPILESRCQPCHFPGGKMYGRLPFDRPSTIVTLGEKLFSRIKDEPSRVIIRRFLAERKN